jgi:hypothetical protein
MVDDLSDLDLQASGPDSHLSPFQQLKKLILAPEQERLGKIETHLSDPQFHVQLVSQALPEAVSRSSSTDDGLAQALAAMVASILRISIKQNPKPLANALYPIMGPAIRKSITEAFRQMVQVVNLALENSLSIQGLKWRWEAIRTGQPFAEIVMLHSLIFKVEQVFLIHRETGLLMAHVAMDETVEDKANIVSGMLTALQEFVKDSFAPGENSSIETVHLEELSLLVEQTPLASLVGVVKGTPPEELRRLLQDTLELITRDHDSDIADFNGDPAPLEIVKPRLRACLESRYRGKKREKPFPIVFILLVIFLVALGGGAYLRVKENNVWSRYISSLNHEPGLIVVETKLPWLGPASVRGLRDPVAKDPIAIMPAHGLSPKRIEQQWIPFISLDPRVVLERARNHLAPPQSVSLRFQEGMLESSGSAPHEWVVQAKAAALRVPGVVSYEDKALVDSDMEVLTHEIADLSSWVFRFSRDIELDPSMDSEYVAALAEKVRLILNKAETLKQHAELIVTGHHDLAGSSDYNLKLSQRRAEAAKHLLVMQGVDANRIRVDGQGSEKVEVESRSATFSIEIRNR